MDSFSFALELGPTLRALWSRLVERMTELGRKKIPTYYLQPVFDVIESGEPLLASKAEDKVSLGYTVDVVYSNDRLRIEKQTHKIGWSQQMRGPVSNQEQILIVVDSGSSAQYIVTVVLSGKNIDRIEKELPSSNGLDNFVIRDRNFRLDEWYFEQLRIAMIDADYEARQKEEER